MRPQDSDRLSLLSGVRPAIRRHRRHLKRTGVVVSQSGGFVLPGGWVSGHSDFGPTTQDKPCNQDRLVLWRPRRQRAGDVNWVLAIADGVTSSYHSEFGAALACWAAVRSLTESVAETFHRRGATAVHTAVAALRTAGVAYRKYGRDWCPADEFPATWKHRLDCGAFLQTTLTLAWCCNHQCHAVRIGDGGATLHDSSGSRVLLSVNPAVQLVHALGPDSPHTVVPDDELSFELPPGTIVTFYTDGLASVVQSELASVVEVLDQTDTTRPRPGIAASLVHHVLQQDHDALSDNLTIAIAAGGD